MPVHHHPPAPRIGRRTAPDATAGASGPGAGFNDLTGEGR